MTTPAHDHMTATEWAMLAALSVLWGGSFFFVAVIVRELPPLTIVSVRVAGAAAALFAVLFAAGIPAPRGGRAWRMLALMGLLNNIVPFTLIVWGQTMIAAGLASILNATTPLFTLLVARVLAVDQRLAAGKLLGAALGLTGVVVMMGIDALAGGTTGFAGQLACLGAALSYACAGIYGRRLAELQLNPIGLAAGQTAMSAAMLVPIALLVDRSWTLAPPSAAAWASLAGLALLSTALAYVLFFRILAGAGAVNVLLTTLLVPVSAILLGAIGLGERLAPQHLAGMAMIGAGLLAIDGRLLRRLQRRGGSPGM